MDSDCYRNGGRLLADIGGTNARFAIERAPGRIDAIATLACASHAGFVDAARAYLAGLPGDEVRHAAIAIANPVEGDWVRMTNHHWQFSIREARDALGLDTLLVVNDFAALAAAVPGLGAFDVMAVGAGQARPKAVIGLVGAGTGLGVAGLIPAGDRWTVLESEGGHASFSPCDEREEEILRFCRSRHDHVSAERLVSGPGLSLIHEALAARRNLPVAAPLSAAVIVERGLSGLDPLCLETLECFCAMLGTVASNLAVTLCARGGIYIGGGVVPRLGEWFAGSPFRARFENKGRFSGFTAQIPTLVITAPYPALSGAATLLAEHLADARGDHFQPRLPHPAAANTERSHASI
jgi:glucokinase